MNITKIIQSRRAIYPSQFENGDINKDQIYKILENANTAPSHKLTQPWFFKVFKTFFFRFYLLSSITKKLTRHNFIIYT